MARELNRLIDEALVLRCREGDTRAMEHLVARWQQRLWRHAMRLIGRPDAAWEVSQEAWLGIVRDLRRLADPSRFSGWAYRIVTYKAADWIRRNQRQRKFAHELVADPPASETPSQSAGDLREALNHLPTGCKAILKMYYLEELSVAEIAEALAIPAGTVKSRLHYARAELKKVWEGVRP